MMTDVRGASNAKAKPSRAGGQAQTCLHAPAINAR